VHSPKFLFFTSTKEARLYWDLIVRRIFLWHSAMRAEGSVTLGLRDILQDFQYDEGRKSFTQSLLDKSNDYKKVAKDWHQAFVPIFERTRNCPGTKENLAASLLMLR
jgi:hypothetical protein